MVLTFTPSLDPWIWMAAILTICMISYAFKETHLWYIAESTIIGVGTGHLFVTNMSNIITKGVYKIQGGQFTLVIPMILGLLIFLRLTEGYRWVSRYPPGSLRRPTRDFVFPDRRSSGSHPSRARPRSCASRPRIGLSDRADTH
jgi:hypothetical protein